MKPLKPSKIFLPILLVISLMLSLHSCEKGTKAAINDFSYVGNLLISDTITFSSTAPATSIFLWNFGDGTTSAQASPYHIYSTSGSYVVTLMVNNNLNQVISKTLAIQSSLYDFTYTGTLWV